MSEKQNSSGNLESLLNKLHNEDYFVRLDAVKALGALGDPGAIDYLIEMLSENGIMRGWVANSLAALGEAQWKKIINGEDNFILGYTYPESDFIRMARSGDNRIIKILLKVLNRPETEYRAEAAKALGILGDKTAVESLKELLYSGYEEVRGNAAKSLAILGEDHWQTIIKGWPTDFIDLRVSGQPWALDILFKACTAGDEKSKIKALKAMYEFKNNDALTLLTDLMKDNDPDVRLQAVQTFSTITDSSMAESLVNVLKDEDVRVRVETLSILIKLQYPGLYDILLNCLHDKSWNIRRKAAVELIRLVSQDTSLLSNAWREAVKIIEIPHDDRLYGGVNVSDERGHCHTDTRQHADVGIGLPIPPELKI
ncbi:MAG TPA: HEAT repeat domain-containing protein [Bacteroidales bacterium]|nr:HEAT repeat domain-containing protein [Bacteroidales bacterium]